MKVLIFGSDGYTALADVQDYVDTIEKCDVLTGDEVGVNGLVAKLADERGFDVLVIEPNFERDGARVAPLKRNLELVTLADRVIVFVAKCARCSSATACPYGGSDHGPADVIKKAHMAKKPCAVKRAGETWRGDV